jgi:hypothetical protein
MHTLAMTTAGLVLLLVFHYGAKVLNRGRARALDGAFIFIWVWLLVSAVNFTLGVLVANIPVLTEIAVHLVVFGLPAAVAWYLSRRARGTP